MWAMKGIHSTLLIGVSIYLTVNSFFGKSNADVNKYSNFWVARIEGGEDVARRIARNLGFTYKGQCGGLTDHYDLIREDHPLVSISGSNHLTEILLDADEVKWAGQQMLVMTETHDKYVWKTLGDIKTHVPLMKPKYIDQIKCITPDCKLFSYKNYKPQKTTSWSMGTTSQVDLSKLGSFSTKPSAMAHYVHAFTTESIGLLSTKTSAYLHQHNDPFWTKQWYLQDYRTEDTPVMDLNVVPVHKMGYTGKGVVIAIVDNGVQHDNFDMKDNFIVRLSYDMCQDIPGSRPIGHNHGTLCAGVIAMHADNEICGVGIAYNANIVGVRAICHGTQIQSVTAKALVHALDEVHIYSNSWGTVRNGKDIYYRDYYTHEAYSQGATKGRGGKGAIYVKSAGNDKVKGDNCAVETDINSQFVITIAGANQWGKSVYYSERCTAVFATTYAMDMFTEGIVAPSTDGNCVDNFAGTSAACPQASAIIALVLEANPELTYRDVMHLITMSAEVAPLANNRDTWYKNGRGFWVSNDFGFGLMNAENMVILAQNWKNVPEMRDCIIYNKLEEPALLKYETDVVVSLTTSACRWSREFEVNYLEHVEVISSVKYPYRGHITIFLTSPEGTTSQLLEARYNDDDSSGFNYFSILSTHNWGENPRGKWVVTFNITHFSRPGDSGWVHEVSLKLHGTKTKPAHYKKKREYTVFRLPDGRTNIS